LPVIMKQHGDRNIYHSHSLNIQDQPHTSTWELSLQGMIGSCPDTIQSGKLQVETCFREKRVSPFLLMTHLPTHITHSQSATAFLCLV
jgi:hypothetical protein